ncbi:MAG TPA: putative Na+/H+ antiporter [Vicinamibacterales bacterium]|nr:putative Na+/H+ antiporter [Vicinamibacterales bacterium]
MPLPLILGQALPLPLSTYPDRPEAALLDVLRERVHLEPFNGVATAIFLLAVLHTFAAARFTRLAHGVQHRADDRARTAGFPLRPSVGAGLLHFLGEVEVVFGLWAVVLFVAMFAYAGWAAPTHYFNEAVNYTEPLFVVVIMALASSRPIIGLAERSLRLVARAGRATPAAWWASILTIGPLLGSFITEPGAMTISAFLLARQFYDLQPGVRLKYATLGLLFVNVSVGGTLTHFAAPPVLMVARAWDWDMAFMFTHFGWRAAAAIALSTAAYLLAFRQEFSELAKRRPMEDREEPDAPAPGALLPMPAWLTIVHVAFMVWTVLTAHHPVFFVGGFLIFLGFAAATSAYQSRIDLRPPLLVGFFLAGLVIHGGLQAWWIAPVLSRLSELPLFISATILTGFNDNALITYLATLVPSFNDSLKLAVVAGAVTGGGLTVIANAPNPAGQAILSRFFDGAVSPVNLMIGALLPTIIAALMFTLF